MELSVTGDGLSVADAPSATSCGGEDWAALLFSMLSCVGVGWVADVAPLMFDCGGWVWSVISLAACVGVGWVNKSSVVACGAVELSLGEGSGGDTLSFHSGPYRCSSCLETLKIETQIRFHFDYCTQPP